MALIENKMRNNYGERLSFFQLFKEKKWRIEIPIIQRDYAQGRQTSLEIRDTFLNTLSDHLGRGKNIDLDFVYGSLSENDARLFIPLDGQQRLTTLFLLHWYLANTENNKKSFDENFVDSKKSKFTYETRTSSTEFCHALVIFVFDVRNLLNADEGRKNSLSKTIKDKEWYFNSWENDPTIQSMLTMLDSIHEKFKNSSGYFEKLISLDNPVVTFQFLNLKNFKLTDDLYIKMNARGKQLTPFENFKAKFEQFIHDLKIPNQSLHKLKYDTGEINVSVPEYFSYKIDTDWANLFWNYRDKKENIYDIQLMNFIRVFSTNHFVLKQVKEVNIDNLKLLIGKEEPDKKDEVARPITFFQYKSIDSLDEKMVLDLISLLDLIVNGDAKIKKYLPNSTYYNEDNIFNDLIQNSLNYTERLRFYAFYYFLILHKTKGSLNAWMRIVFNLTQNTNYNNSTEYSRSLKSLKVLLQNSHNILSFIQDNKNTISSFLDLQILEERIKACLINKNDQWMNAIIEIESHRYFNGQIGFILSFSGIEKYFIKNKNCDWTNVEDNMFYKSFKDYSIKAKSIFDSDGLIEFPDFIWERALLSKGNYLLSANSNISFLDNYDRDISWKRLLRDSNDGKREYIKDLFDDSNFNQNDVINSLKLIILKSKITDWRIYFVKLKEIIEYLGPKKYIRFEDEGENIQLLEKKRMSGPHKEYYTFAFYLENWVSNKFSPFTNRAYYQVNGDEDSPCAAIENWTFAKKNYGFYLYGCGGLEFELYFSEFNETKIDDKIINVLVANRFVVYENSYVLKIYRDDIMKVIDQLCLLFINLKE